ncbi:MAG TPA: hypothetical protein VFO27_14885 [Bryobacteraceae bacterium]|nr:hypothetical protein [Bryobacteraceae bacterium]
MAGATGKLRQLWERVRTKDPYWDDFLHRPPADPKNVVTPAILSAPAGSVFLNLTDVHDPGAMSGHLKEAAKFFGSDATGIAALTEGAPENASDSAHRFAVVCMVAAVEEVRENTGIGGQFAMQKCATANFNVASYIRELGYPATVTTENVHAYAAAAGLGTLDSDGRLVSRQYGRKVGLAGAVLTSIPLVADRPSP